MAGALFLIMLLGSPAEEVRAVWLDRSSLVTRAEIATTLDDLREANFNLVLVNVWSRGYPLWRSKVFAAETGLLIDPAYVGRDPLAEVIEEASRRGLFVMPWFEYGFIGGYSGYFPGVGGQGPIFDRHPDWLARTRTGGTAFVAPGGFFFWMAAANPEVQDFLLRLVEEVARDYRSIASWPLAGIQFDRARYPQLDCGYDEVTLALYRQETGLATTPDPAAPGWMNWRAERLNRFLLALHERLRSVGPGQIVSNAPIVYPYSYLNFLQEYPSWMSRQAVDVVMPQIYRRDSLQFTAELDRQLPLVLNPSTLVPGIDSTNPTVDELVRMIEAVRHRGLPGVAIWYYRALRNKGALALLRQTVFDRPARLPWPVSRTVLDGRRLGVPTVGKTRVRRTVGKPSVPSP